MVRLLEIWFVKTGTGCEVFQFLLKLRGFGLVLTMR